MPNENLPGIKPSQLKDETPRALGQKILISIHNSIKAHKTTSCVGQLVQCSCTSQVK